MQYQGRKVIKLTYDGAEFYVELAKKPTDTWAGKCIIYLDPAEAPTEWGRYIYDWNSAVDIVLNAELVAKTDQFFGIPSLK